MGSERDAAIANMESMGFARADIDAAMRAAFFNPDRAVEYLLTVRLRKSHYHDRKLTVTREFQRVLNRNSKTKRVVQHHLQPPPVVTLVLPPLLPRPLAATNP